MDGILSYIIDALYSLPGILVGLSFHEWVMRTRRISAAIRPRGILAA